MVKEIGDKGQFSRRCGSVSRVMSCEGRSVGRLKSYIDGSSQRNKRRISKSFSIRP